MRGLNIDYVVNGVAQGDTAEEFADTNYNSGLYRPFRDRNGNRCVIVNVGMHYDADKGREVPTYEKMTTRWARFLGYDTPALYVKNASLLRKDEWIMFDQVVVEVARQRLRVWADLAAASTYSINGWAAEILEHETVNDPGEAMVDMDGLTPGRTDRHLYQLEGLPLPVTHSDFWFSDRKLAVSRRSGQPLNTMMARACSQRISELIEKTTIGVVTGLTYGTTANYGRAPTVRGYLNAPNVNTKSNLTAPTGINSDTTVNEVLTMRSTLYGDGFYGPYVIYNSTDWDAKLDADYYAMTTSGATSPTQTLRQRITRTEDIQAVRRADFFTPTAMGGTFGLLMVSLSRPDVARAVIGMPIRVLQWPSRGGMQLNFKVMCIMVPQVRSDYNGQSGIVYGSAT